VIFISYRNNEVYKKYKDEFLISFKALCNSKDEWRNYKDDIWSDYKLSGSDEWNREIINNISNCKVAIYFTGKESFESEYIIDQEVIPVLEKAKNDPFSIKVFWLCVDSFDFVKNRFGEYQCSNVIKKENQKDGLNTFLSLKEMDESQVESVLNNLSQDIINILSKKKIEKTLIENFKNNLQDIDRNTETEYIDYYSKKYYENDLKFQQYYWFCDFRDNVSYFIDTMRYRSSRGDENPVLKNIRIDSSFLAFDKDHLIINWIKEMRKVLKMKKINDTNSIQIFSIKQILDHCDSNFIAINHIVYSTFLQYKQTIFLDFIDWLKFEFSKENDLLGNKSIVFIFSLEKQKNCEFNLTGLNNKLEDKKSLATEMQTGNLYKMKEPSKVNKTDLQEWEGRRQLDIKKQLKTGSLPLDELSLNLNIEIPKEGVYLKTLIDRLRKL